MCVRVRVSVCLRVRTYVMRMRVFSIIIKTFFIF